MGIRILVVEDEAEIADFVVRGLREEGLTVEHAPDGHDGWHRLSTESWDVILLDWWLPGVEGFQLLERFRRAGGTAPVLFLTARDAISDRVRGLDGGADDYLCKPFAFEELLARVRSLDQRECDRGAEHDDLPMGAGSGERVSFIPCRGERPWDVRARAGWHAPPETAPDRSPRVRTGTRCASGRTDPFTPRRRR